jgi:DNA invertase Pin-like site-specific DNA recombinase
VGIYCRVSTTEQKQLNSLSNQVSGLLKYLKEEGMLYRFQDAYIDIYSGTSEKRSPAN